MKDLTRREIVLLCAYVTLLVVGLRWVVRGIWAEGDEGSAAGTEASVAVALEAPPAPARVDQEASPAPEADGSVASDTAATTPAVSPAHLRVALSVQGPQGPAEAEQLRSATVRVFASRDCPEQRLSDWLAMPGCERQEAELADELDPLQGARFVALEPTSRHVSVYVNGRLVAVALTCDSDGELAIEIDPSRFTPSGASLRACFRDSQTLAPLEGRVTLERGGTSAREGALDGAGELLLEELEPGPARLIAHFADRGTWRRDLELSASSRIDLGVIDLPRANAVRGQIIRPGGGSAAFPVLLESLATLDEPAELVSAGERDVRLTYSEEDGRFQIAPVEPGRYLLRVPSSDEGFPSPTPAACASGMLEVEIREGELEEHDLVLEPTRRVSLHATLPAEPVYAYQVLDALGHSLRMGRIQDGRLPELELCGGSYHLVLLGPLGEQARGTFGVAEGSGDVVVDVSLATVGN